MLVSCLCAADAKREQALQGILQELALVKQDQTARADKLGDKALSDQAAKRHDTLVTEWKEALSAGSLAPGSTIFKWREDLQKSLVTMQAKKKEKAVAAIQEKLDYVAWLLGKADPRFDGGGRVTMY
jgi:hypothetical protein